MPAPNYRVLVSFDSDRKVFSARAPELEHCYAEGSTRAEAISRIEEEIEAQVHNMLASGANPPSSLDEQDFSGEVALKLSKQLHRDLSWQAHSEGVDLNHLTGELLAAALEQRRQGRLRGGNRAHGESQFDGQQGRQRGRFGGQHYPGMMDDRANFIEYVRGLEQGGHAGHHNQGPGRGGPGGGRRRRGRGGPGGGGPGPGHQGGGPGPNGHRP